MSMALLGAGLGVDASVIADFTGTPLNGGAPLEVTFTNLSIGSTSWTWAYEDVLQPNNWLAFDQPNAENPVQSFPGGTYSIRLTAVGPGGSDIKTRTNYVTVQEV